MSDQCEGVGVPSWIHHGGRPSKNLPPLRPGGPIRRPCADCGKIKNIRNFRHFHNHGYLVRSSYCNWCHKMQHREDRAMRKHREGNG